jgi:hypothetical protein
VGGQVAIPPEAGPYGGFRVSFRGRWPHWPPYVTEALRVGSFALPKSSHPHRCTRSPGWSTRRRSRAASPPSRRTESTCPSRPRSCADVGRSLRVFLEIKALIAWVHGSTHKVRRGYPAKFLGAGVSGAALSLGDGANLQVRLRRQEFKPGG